jgi:hypothetical protein
MASLRGYGCVSNAQLPLGVDGLFAKTLHLKTSCVSVATTASVFPLDACVSVMTVQTRNTARRWRRRRAGRQHAPRSASACCRDSSRRNSASGGGSVWSNGRARRSAVGSPC